MLWMGKLEVFAAGLQHKQTFCQRRNIAKSIEQQRKHWLPKKLLNCHLYNLVLSYIPQIKNHKLKFLNGFIKGHFISENLLGYHEAPLANAS
jgi:hypothetical protein